MDQATFVRFTAKTAPENENGCIIWTGALNSAGYPVLGLSPAMQEQTNGKKIGYAHRLSYEHANGPIPEGLMMRHRCDTPACVNPDHLTVGTAKDNAHDAVERGRLGGDKGRKRAKLNADWVRDMRIRYKAGQVTIAELLVETGVHKGTLFSALHGRRWKHVI